ncbi:hypothetical protein, conserved [Leishmania tarentolae]|uniref:Uncharacterized protein n=1 Tax=Leishmania tarentolae TaxID=5689 RepID=A0A640KF94_LEITA|nr:hypothetical protein, conserved [Leishmania tarentolae]
MNAMELRPTWALVCAVLVMTVAQVAGATSTTYVAPDPVVGLSAKNQEYLIGVVSFIVVVVACFMGVASMLRIDYDDDSLLMVEVPGDLHQEKD